jgi:hypothetical protein
MHLRRLASFLLGIWIGGSLFMALVAVQNFRSVDRLLASPAPNLSAQIDKMGGAAAARTVFRHQASEQNRWFFNLWERVQLGIGAALLLILLFGTHVGKGTLTVAGSMLLITAVQHWYLTPSIVTLGRSLDWLDRTVSSAERNQFWTLHNTYSVVEILKWMLGFVLLGKLLLRSRTKRHEEIDADFEFLEDQERQAG